MNNKPIGIYDSGVGAVAVLKTIEHILPNEKYILFADFANAPYGEKTKDEILLLARNGVKTLIDAGAKAVVVACNTATSAAVEELRAENDIPIIGMEPAIKPASEHVHDGKVLVLATPATLRLMKFKKLTEKLGGENIIPVSCPNLSRLIEEEKPGSEKIKDYLKDILSEFDKDKISAIVIGCTHFSFIETDIKEASGCGNVFDGRHGTARHLKHVLEENSLIGDGGPKTEFVLDAKDENYRMLLSEFVKLPLSFEE